MDGFEATKKIRQIDNNLNKTKIIAITANALKEDLEKCILAGMDSYLSKPFKFEDIERIIFEENNRKIK